MTTTERLERLEWQNTQLRVVAGVIVAIGGLCTFLGASGTATGTLDEVVAKRIVIRDDKGNDRMVLSANESSASIYVTMPGNDNASLGLEVTDHAFTLSGVTGTSGKEGIALLWGYESSGEGGVVFDMQNGMGLFETVAFAGPSGGGFTRWDVNDIGSNMKASLRADKGAGAPGITRPRVVLDDQYGSRKITAEIDDKDTGRLTVGPQTVTGARFSRAVEDFERGAVESNSKGRLTISAGNDDWQLRRSM